MDVQRVQTDDAAPDEMPDEQPRTDNGAVSAESADTSGSPAAERLTAEPHEESHELDGKDRVAHDGGKPVPEDRVPQFLQDLLTTSLDKPSDLVQIILDWLGPESARAIVSDKGTLDLFLSRLVAEIDRCLREQVNQILHHPEFQALESAWRGLDYLVSQVSRDEAERIKLRVLNFSWRDLRRDMQLANEFDQSELFRKVYEEEFGTAGGEPFGLLIGNYEFERNNDDLEVLEHIAGVAQAAFAPFITGATPSLIGLDRFEELQRVREIGSLAPDAATATWNRLRQHDHSRFIGMVLPHILLRTPYRDDGERHDGFRYWEDTSELSHHLWGNAAWAFGAVAIRAFDQTSWLADIRGVKRGAEVGGLVPAIASDAFQTDRAEPAVFKPLTDVIITDRHEKRLSELGFVPLAHLRESGRAAFYNTLSLHRPKEYTDSSASASERLSSMLHYTLCASRFAHYLKLMMRDRVGSYDEPETLQDELNHWLSNFVRADEDASPDVMARYPLREGRVRIWRTQPGKFASEMHLRPHYQLDALAASVRLQTEMREA